jgi:IS5 family transposase
VSSHPGYWDEIVSAKHDSAVKRGVDESLHAFERRWFDSVKSSNWVARFQKLLIKHRQGSNFLLGINQLLYDATKSCDALSANLTISVKGQYSSTFDYGMSIIVSDIFLFT